MKSKIKDLSILIVGFLSALMGFLATLNIKFEWLTEASINTFGALFIAFVMLVSSLYAIWKNTYTSKTGGLQKKTLQSQNLIKK